jgi:hypothetical protein
MLVDEVLTLMFPSVDIRQDTEMNMLALNFLG